MADDDVAPGRSTGPSTEPEPGAATGSVEDRIEPEPATRSTLATMVAWGTPILLVAIVLGGWSVMRSVDVTEVVPAPGAPTAPKLAASGPDQVVYRIDAYRSTVGYEVEEILAGRSNTARGSTSGIAGDILIDTANPGASEVGDIVVNVEQLTSDQSIRDNRLRHDFLQSTHHPLATITTDTVTGLPDRIEDGVTYDLTLTGDLTVREITKPQTYAATATRTGDTLRIDATIDTLLSDFGIGPISLGPLVSTGNEVRLVIAIEARDIAAEPVGDELAAGDTSSTGPAASSVSFSSDVQPILESNCASCHNTGESGSAVWTLDTAAQAHEAGNGLQLVTGTGYMPPWPASEVGVPLQHARTMSDEDIRTIAGWAAEGSPLDVDPATAIEPAPDELEGQFAIRDDLLLTADAPYQGSEALTNDYRCTILDPQFTEDRFISGFEFRPDQRENVHHALVFKVDQSQVALTEELDAADPGTGWQCFAGMRGPGGTQGVEGGTTGSQLIMGWVPGQRPNKLPDGAGISMKAGDVFVVQTHYHFPHAPDPDRSQLAVELSDRTDLDEVITQTYLGPAEIPCAPGETGVFCDRDKVIERISAEYGPSAANIPDGLMLLCRQSLPTLQQLVDGIARSSCDQRIRRDGELLAVHGHMHEIGNDFRMTLNPGTPEEKVLLDIPDWDFQWQLIYAPQEQIQLKRGDVVRIECSWDRALIKSSEPMYITWAEGTEDEMCYSTITTRIPREGAAP